MQYTQRKLQRSVTDMRRSRKSRDSLSVSNPVGVATAPEKSGIALTLVTGMMRRDMIVLFLAGGGGKAAAMNFEQLILAEGRF
jgi:hypothetical protein